MKSPSFAQKILETVLSPPVALSKLSKLAAQGMFASVLLDIPSNVHNADFKIHYEGVPTKRSVLEVYAPGDETGCAAVYKESVNSFHSGEVELIWGKWELFQGVEPVEVVFGDYLTEEERAEMKLAMDKIVDDDPDDVDSQIEEDMYKEYFRGEGYPYGGGVLEVPDNITPAAWVEQQDRNNTNLGSEDDDITGQAF